MQLSPPHSCKIFSLPQKETLYPLSKHSSFSPSPSPGNLSTFYLYGFIYSRYFIYMQSRYTKAFCVQLPSLSMFSGFIHIIAAQHVSALHSFLWLNIISLFGYTILVICLPGDGLSYFHLSATVNHVFMNIHAHVFVCEKKIFFGYIPRSGNVEHLFHVLVCWLIVYLLWRNVYSNTLSI